MSRRRDPSRRRPRLSAVLVLAVACSVLVTSAFAAAQRGANGSRDRAPGPSDGRRPALRAPNRVPGIDVSQWQLDVDWPAVAGTRIRFVIMRATRADDFIDPTYLTNLHDATTAGLAVGSYHRATPSDEPGDATSEANHFLSVARNGPGDVLPVLDIEETGGLTPTGLTAWVRTWVVRVRNRLGVRPMVYSSPYFWRSNMGDTLWFANHGFPLWIAHWGVSSPDVPANDWGGNGWTFWQFTSSGHVHGIGPRVDRDRYRGANLAGGRIASLRVVPRPGGRVAGDRISCGANASRCRRLANPGDELLLTADPAPGATLLRWTGRCAPAGSAPTCTVTATGARTVGAVFGYPLHVSLGGSGSGSVGSAPPGIDCPATSCAGTFPAASDVELSADPDSASGFVAWGGACAGSTPSCIVTVDGPTDVSARFDATIALEEDGAGTAYTWGRRTDRRALGGSYRWERRSGATTSFGFTGGAVSLFTVEGPSFGRGRIAIDGATVDTFDGYAGDPGRGDRLRFEELGPGRHTLTVTVLGTARPKATGTRVGVDGLRASGVLDASPDPTASTWGPVTDASASGGTYVASEAPGATAAIRFHGTGITLRTLRGPALGVVELWVDGSRRRSWDLSAASWSYGVRRTLTGLADGAHVARLVVVGSTGADRHGAAVAVDGWIVR